MRFQHHHRYVPSRNDTRGSRGSAFIILTYLGYKNTNHRITIRFFALFVYAVLPLSSDTFAFESKMPRVSSPTVFAFSATLSYALTKISDSDFLSIFCRVYATCLLLWTIYRFILYPNLFSPLRHLPTVDSDSWWSRQSLRLFTEPSGVPQSDWYVPSSHLIPSVVPVTSRSSTSG